MKDKVLALTAMAEALGRDMMYFPSSFTTAEFHPKKHTVMSYSKQNRIAKSKRRRNGRKK